jgi:hypothetical protein
MTRLDKEDALQMWLELLKDAISNTPETDPFYTWLINQQKSILQTTEI